MNNMDINGALLRDMFITGAQLLEKNKAIIDLLNVFPVPDGDTGTNMSMTMQSAVKELKAGGDNDTVGQVAAAASLGALKGARGNSGVILSQIFRGFAKALDGKDGMDAASLSAALEAGTAAAYKAVMRPKEGTMLTVARMVGEAVAEQQREGANVFGLIDTMVDVAQQAVKLTPDLLPVLKEAGVVDSGGKGLLIIFTGFKMAVDGEEIDDSFLAQSEPAVLEDNLTLEDINDIKFGYCTEFFVIHLVESFTEADLDKFRDKLQKIGDSVVVANDADFIKVHVHSNVPGKILQLALRLGEIDKLKIENMREQNREIQENMKKNEKESAMIAVAAGDGISEIFNSLGVCVLIEGGQTMNPSIDTIEKAIRRANARNVFILPNNPNIIMAAQQAAELSCRNVIVIPSKTIQQGITAAAAYMEGAVEDSRRSMTEAMSNVISGCITYSVRDTSFNGTAIKKGDIIGLINGSIAAVGQNVASVAEEVLGKMMEGKEEPVITIFYGQDVEGKQAEEFLNRTQEAYPDAEIVCERGGQPLYYYHLSVE